MLVTCLKCKKPVFVSSSMVSGGEAAISCNACSAELLITTAGTVRLPSGDGAEEEPAESTGDGSGDGRGAAPPDRGGTDGTTDVTVSPPTTGLGSGGQERCGSTGAGSWSPRVVDMNAAEITLDMAAPPSPPETRKPKAVEPPSKVRTVEIVATPAEPELEPEREPRLPPPPPPREPPPPPREPPPPPPKSPSPESSAELAVVRFEPKPPAPPPPPVFEPAKVAPATEPAPELVEATADAEPPPAPEPAGEPEPRATSQAPFEPPEPGPGPAPTDGPPVGPAAIDVPEPGLEPGTWEEPTSVETAADPEVAAPAGGDQWQVASRLAEATLGRATVPMDQAAFRRGIRHGRWPRIIAGALMLVVGSGALWAGGIIKVPGVSVPAVLQGLFPTPEAADPGAAEVAGLRSVASEPVAPAPMPTPVELTHIQPVPAAAAAHEDRPKNKRRRKGKRLGHEESEIEPESGGATTAPASAATSRRAASSRTSAPPSVKPPTPPATAAHTAELHYRQGNSYLKEKKVGLAIAEYKACLAENSRYGLAYRSLGVAYMLLGREKSAIQAYEQFVKTMPAHRDAGKVKQIIADYYSRNP
jgi:hypothetical protein